MFYLLVYIRAIKTTYFSQYFLLKKNKLSFATNKKGEMRLEEKSDKLMKGGGIYFLIVFPLEKKVLMKKLKVLIVRDGPQIVISVSLKHRIDI
jgi:hypothetical protein